MTWDPSSYSVPPGGSVRMAIPESNSSLKHALDACDPEPFALKLTDDASLLGQPLDLGHCDEHRFRLCLKRRKRKNSPNPRRSSDAERR